jgi:hypothetical protein
MKSFETSTVIHAAPTDIWAILTDAARWPEWNTTIDGIDGQIVPGGQVTVRAKASPGRAFPVKVSEFEPGRRMVWTAGMPLGLFKGERTFTLTEQPGGGVQFAMREVFSGLMAPLITKSIPDLQPSFDEFAAGLKRRAEGTA